MFLVCLMRLWEIMGTAPAPISALYVVVEFVSFGVFWRVSKNLPQDLVSASLCKEFLDANSHKKLLRPMLSHGIPRSRDESRNSKRGADLDAVSKIIKKAGFIQAPAFI